ncbi:MAG: hypothetical protein ACKVQT_19020 [Burkholderiales bacterium]
MNAKRVGDRLHRAITGRVGGHHAGLGIIELVVMDRLPSVAARANVVQAWCRPPVSSNRRGRGIARVYWRQMLFFKT